MPLTSYTPGQGFPVFASQIFENRTVTTLPSDATLTAAQIIGGLIVDTEAGASTFTMPTAALLNAAIQGAAVGSSFTWYLRNTGNNTATVAVGAGGTSATGNTLTVATVNTRKFLVIVTGVANGSDPTATDAYTLYSLGVSAH